MGMTVTAKVRSGSREWIFQRISNLLICAWGVTFILQILLLDSVDFVSWQGVFQPLWFRVFSTVVLSFVALNSVLAGWQIGADYVKAVVLNKIYMLVCLIGSAACFAAGIYVLWLL